MDGRRVEVGVRGGRWSSGQPVRVHGPQLPRRLNPEREDHEIVAEQVRRIGGWTGGDADVRKC